MYDWNKAKQSLFKVPVKSANISNLVVTKDYLYWVDNGPDNDYANGKVYALKMEESKKYEPAEIATGVTALSLSANMKK